MIRFFQRPRLVAARIFFVFSTALLVSSCATIPVQEFGVYETAFEKSRAASSTVYQQLIPVFKVAGVDETPAEPPIPAAGGDTALKGLANAGPAADQAAQPTRYYVRALGPGFGLSSAEDDCKPFARYRSLLIRCQAFSLVSRYNELVAKLNSGAPQNAAQTELSGLSTLLGSIKGLAGLVSGPIASVGITELLSIVDAAIDSQSKHDILVELRRGLPKIQEFIELLKRDVELVYDIKRVYAENQISLLDTKLIDTGGRFESNFNYFKDPALSGDQQASAAYNTILDEYREALDAVSGAEVFGADEKLNAIATWPRNGPVFSLRDQGRATGHLNNFKAAAKEFAAVEEELRTFEAALVSYKDMLTELENATEQLRANTLTDLDLSVLGPLNPLQLVTDEKGAPRGFSGTLAEIFQHAETVQTLLASPR